MPTMSHEQANAAIAEKIEKVNALLADCQAIADETGVSFSFAPAYGMGGFYESGEWNASSQNC